MAKLASIANPRYDLFLKKRKVHSGVNFLQRDRSSFVIRNFSKNPLTSPIVNVKTNSILSCIFHADPFLPPLRRVFRLFHYPSVFPLLSIRARRAFRERKDLVKVSQSRSWNSSRERATRLQRDSLSFLLSSSLPLSSLAKFSDRRRRRAFRENSSMKKGGKRAGRIDRAGTFFCSRDLCVYVCVNGGCR